MDDNEPEEVWAEENDPPVHPAVLPWMNDVAALILAEPDVHPFLHLQGAQAVFLVEELDDPDILRIALANAADMLIRLGERAEALGLADYEIQAIIDDAAVLHHKDEEFDE